MDIATGFFASGIFNLQQQVPPLSLAFAISADNFGEFAFGFLIAWDRSRCHRPQKPVLPTGQLFSRIGLNGLNKSGAAAAEFWLVFKNRRRGPEF
jgi:hypothetical protein